MQAIYVNSQFIRNLNSIFDKEYFSIQVIKYSGLSSSIYELQLIFQNDIIMKLNCDSEMKIENNSQNEKDLINQMVDVLEKMILKELAFGKICYYTDSNGRQVRSLKTCINEIENNNG